MIAQVLEDISGNTAPMDWKHSSAWTLSHGVTDVLVGLRFIPRKRFHLAVGLWAYSSCDFIGGNGPEKPKGNWKHVFSDLYSLQLCFLWMLMPEVTPVPSLDN